MKTIHKEISKFIFKFIIIIFLALLFNNGGLITSLLIFIFGIICMFKVISDLAKSQLSEKDYKECNRILIFIGGFFIILSLIILILKIIYP